MDIKQACSSTNCFCQRHHRAVASSVSQHRQSLATTASTSRLISIAPTKHNQLCPYYNPIQTFRPRGGDSSRCRHIAAATPPSALNSSSDPHATTPQPPESLQPELSKKSSRKIRFRLVSEGPDAPTDRQRPEDNPSLDDIVLDEQYYRELGLSQEEAREALRQLDATEVDPEGSNFGPGDEPWTSQSSGFPTHKGLLGLNAEGALRGHDDAEIDADDAASGWQQQQLRFGAGKGLEGEEGGGPQLTAAALDDTARGVRSSSNGGGADSVRRYDSGGGGSTSGGLVLDSEEADGEVYGPEAVLLAGFPAEEQGVVRALLDSAGGHVIRVLPVTEAMLYGTVDQAVHSEEMDWSAPRPTHGSRGGGWGAQRTVMFSGLGVRAQLTVLELLESGGLQAVCAAVAVAEQAERRLGEVLAEAVAAQRRSARQLPRETEPWQSLDGGGRIADRRRGLAPLEELIGAQRAQERLTHGEGEVDTEASGGGEGIEEDGEEDGGSGRPGEVLGEAGRRAAEAAEAEWAAWSSAAAEGRGVATAPAGDVDPGSEGDLKDLGMDMGQLRDTVIRQLAEMDPEALEEFLEDVPYDTEVGWGDVSAAAAAAEGEEREGVRSAGEQAGAGAQERRSGMTAEDAAALAVRQRQRWRAVQESIEAAAAAEGRLVVGAESELLSQPVGASASAAVDDGVPYRSPAPAATDVRKEPPPPPAAAPAASASAAAPPRRPQEPQPGYAAQTAPPRGGVTTARQEGTTSRPRASSSAPPPPLEPSPSSFALDGDGGFSDLDVLLGQLSSPSGASSPIPTTAAASGVVPQGPVGGSTAAADAAAGLQPAAAAATPSGAPPSRASGATTANATISNILQQVQAAARNGAQPEVIQKMLDELYGTGSSAAVPSAADGQAPAASDAATTNGTAGASGELSPPSKRRGSLFSGLRSSLPAGGVAGPVPAAETAPRKDSMTQVTEPTEPRQRPRRSYGPTPPPKPDPVLKPLLDMRPDFAKKLQDKQVRFMDLSRLNDKQKRQWMEYQTRLRVEQQVLQQQQQQRQQQQQQEEVVEGGENDPLWEASQHEGVQQHEGDEHEAGWGGQDGAEEVADEGGEEEEGGEMEEDGREEEEGEEEEGDDKMGTPASADQLRQLVEASRDQEQSVEDTLAQAVAMGVTLSPQALAEAGLQPPSEEALARARVEYERMFQQWAAEEGLDLTGGQGGDDGGDGDTDSDDKGGGGGGDDTHIKNAGGKQGMRMDGIGPYGQAGEEEEVLLSVGRRDAVSGSAVSGGVSDVTRGGVPRRQPSGGGGGAAASRPLPSSTPRPWGTGLARSRRSPVEPPPTAAGAAEVAQ